jgi:threonine-phosphate decarboxylase
MLYTLLSHSFSDSVFYKGGILMALVHGGDVEGYVRQFGAKPLDFSANVSPLGIPNGVRQAIISSLDHADGYPDPLCRRLCEAIAAHEGKEPEQVVCGNGAADIIFRLVQGLCPKTALLLAPTFAEYEQSLRLIGCEIRYHTLHPENNFRLTEDVLKEINPGTDVFFLCQPNNPTGQCCERPLLLEILERCRACQVTLVVDECFVDFLDEPKRYSLADQLEEYENLFILKAFTKIYAMAGVRLGYGLSGNAELLNLVRASGQPWPVSSLAQAAGVAALKETNYVARLKTLLSEEKPFLLKELTEAGVICLGSSANYIFVESPDPQMHTKLRQAGIMIRDCSNFDGLSAGYYRIAVRTHEDNRNLVDTIRTILRG